MTQAVNQLLFSAVVARPVDYLEIVFDEKTLASPERKLLVDMCLSMPSRLIETLQRNFETWPVEFLRLAIENARLRSQDVRVRFSDEGGASDSRHGLRLAHWLARHHLASLRKRRTPSMVGELIAAGWSHCSTDVTRFLTMPLSEAAIADWARETGLPEPVC